MADFESLTAEEQRTLTSFDAQRFRPECGNIFNRLARASDIVIEHDASIAPILAKLDDDAVIPYTGTLAGALPLTALEMRGTLADIKATVDAHFTPGLHVITVKAVGSANVRA